MFSCVCIFTFHPLVYYRNPYAFFLNRSVWFIHDIWIYNGNAKQVIKKILNEQEF